MEKVEDSLSFSLSLFQGGYNNMQKKTCDKVCNSSIDFAKVNGTVLPYDFLCVEEKQSVSFKDSIVSFF